MRINRRASTLGLLATSVAVTSPAILNSQSSSGEAPPELSGVTWDMRGAETKADAYNLRTAKTPLLRARCHSEDGVRRALDWARRTDRRFSLQSGGHCYEGLSQSDDLIIDLSALADTRLTNDGDLIAGPGTRLWQANDATAQKGRALPAGYCQHVALGGHVCGGGIGILSRSFGLTCDNLRAARLLTSEGDILDVSQATHPDLFWALRGGGSGSFGIVTEFRLKTHTIERAALTDFYWSLPNTDAGQFLHEAQILAHDLDDTLSPYVYFTAQSEDTTLVRLRLASLANETRTSAAVASFTHLAQPLTDPQTSAGSYVETANAMWPRDYNPRVWLKNKSAFLNGPVDAGIWQSAIEVLAADWQNEIWVSVERLGGRIDALAPGDTAFVHRRGPEFLLGIGVTQSDKGNPDTMLTSMRQAFRTFEPAAAPGTYVNYPDQDIADWKAAYWGENYPRLAKIKHKIDPDDVFHHAQSIKAI